MESGNPLVGAEPEISMAVFEDAPNHLPCETIGPIVVGEETGCRIEFRQPVLGSNPDPAGAIDMDEVGEVVTNLPRLVVQTLINAEGFGLRIKAMKAGIAAQPKVSVTVFFDVGELDRAIFRHINGRFSSEGVDS